MKQRCITRQVQIWILKLNYSKTTNIYTMGLCVLYYVEYSLCNVKKVGFFYLVELHFNDPIEEGLRKHCGKKKEKMLVNRIFSFSQCFLLHQGEKSSF